MYPAPGRAVKNQSYQVKNTFLEFPIPEDDGAEYKRRSRSDIAGMEQDIRHSPLVVASKSPHCSPLLQPVDETMMAMPIDDVNFELLEEAVDPDQEGDFRTRLPSDPNMPTAQAAGNVQRDEPAYVVATSPYVVPTTPSPFLHSSFPPSTAVPPFGGYGGFDLGLPPAYGDGNGEGDGYGELDQSHFMGGMGMTMGDPGVYDGSYGYMPYGWAAMPVEGDGSGGVAFGEGMQDSVGGGNAWGGADKTGAWGGEANAWEDNAWEDVADGGVAAASGGPGNYEGAYGADGQPVQERPAKEGRSRGGKGRNKLDKETGEDRSERQKGSEKDVSGATNGDGMHERESRKKGERAERAERVEKKGGGNEDHGQDDEIPANYTTVMLRNIPNKYTREMLIKQLSIEFTGVFDFMYLPIDFKNKCNVGYGFINFRTPEVCAKFVSLFHNVDVRKCLPGLNSKKIVEVTPARVQGLIENVRRLRNSPVMNQLQDHPEWMPLLFNKDGIEEPFPMPDAPLPPVKPRGRNREAAA